MKNILSRFTKQIQITSYFNCLNSVICNLNIGKVSQYFKENTKRNIRSNSSSSSMKFNKIIISDHAYKRWNERVSLEENKQNLQERLNTLNDLGRISIFNGSIALIDKEVLFVFETTSAGEMVITTFYGRLSQNPSLNQFEAMRNYNAQFDEFIALNLDKALLAELLPPPIPVQRMCFQGDTTSYVLEQYCTQDNTLFLLSITDGPGKGQVREFYLNEPSTGKIEKSVRQALIIMGFEMFVFEHISIHYPEALKKRMDRISRVNEP